MTSAASASTAGKSPGSARWRFILRASVLSVRARTDLLVEPLEPVRRKARRLAQRDDLALVGLDLGDGFRDPGGDLGGDRHGAVLVGVDQVAGLHPQPPDLDRQAGEIGRAHVWTPVT